MPVYDGQLWQQEGQGCCYDGPVDGYDPLDFAIDSIMKTSLIAATLATVEAAQYVKGKCGGDSKWHYDIWAPESKGSRSHGARREECCQSS